MTVTVRPSSPSAAKMHILQGKIADGCKPLLAEYSVFAASQSANLQKSSFLSSDEMQNE